MPTTVSSSTAHGLERKSLQAQENHDVRAYFFRKHRDELARAGVAHLFLLDSARRRLATPDSGRGPAWRLALAAAREAPLSRRPYQMLLRVAPGSRIVSRPFRRVLSLASRVVKP
ncbi:hypothetical protein [Botrimarina sp.]|uniref:hypothetical protein n=1 Tax=Botrimarina sp. TaxID=2795802 RepID=UPI0032EB67F8